MRYRLVKWWHWTARPALDTAGAAVLVIGGSVFLVIGPLLIETFWLFLRAAYLGALATLAYAVLRGRVEGLVYLDFPAFWSILVLLDVTNRALRPTSSGASTPAMQAPRPKNERGHTY